MLGGCTGLLMFALHVLMSEFSENGKLVAYGASDASVGVLDGRTLAVRVMC